VGTLRPPLSELWDGSEGLLELLELEDGDGNDGLLELLELEDGDGNDGLLELLELDELLELLELDELDDDGMEGVPLLDEELWLVDSQATRLSPRLANRRTLDNLLDNCVLIFIVCPVWTGFLPFICKCLHFNSFYPHLPKLNPSFKVGAKVYLFVAQESLTGA